MEFLLWTAKCTCGMCIYCNVPGHLKGFEELQYMYMCLKAWQTLQEPSNAIIYYSSLHDHKQGKTLWDPTHNNPASVYGALYVTLFPYTAYLHTCTLYTCTGVCVHCYSQWVLPLCPIARCWCIYTAHDFVWASSMHTQLTIACNTMPIQYIVLVYTCTGTCVHCYSVLPLCPIARCCMYLHCTW
jgi:hypothetical protein